MNERILSGARDLLAIRTRLKELVSRNPQLRQAMVEAFDRMRQLDHAFEKATEDRTAEEFALAREQLANGRVVAKGFAAGRPVFFVTIHGLCPADLKAKLSRINETNEEYEEFQKESAAAALPALDRQRKYNSPSTAKEEKKAMAREYRRMIKQRGVAEHTWMVIVEQPLRWKTILNPFSLQRQELEKFSDADLSTIALFRLGGLLDVGRLRPLVRRPNGDGESLEGLKDGIRWRLRMPVKPGYNEMDEPVPSASELTPYIAQQFLEIVEEDFGDTSAPVSHAAFTAGIEAMYGECRANARVVRRRGSRAKAFVDLCCGALNMTANVCAVLDLPSGGSPSIGSLPNPLSPNSVGHSALYHLVHLDVWYAEAMDAELELDANDLAAIANSAGASEPLKLSVQGYDRVGRPHELARVLAGAVRESAFKMMGVAMPPSGTVEAREIAKAWKNLGTTPFPIKGLTDSLFEHLRVLVYEQCHRVASSAIALVPGAPSRKAPGEGMSKEEANEIAKSLLRKDEGFASKTIKEWAKAIGCSTGNVAKLPIWKAMMEKRRQARTGPKPKVKQLTRRMTSVLNASGEFVSPGHRLSDAEPSSELDQLIEEQEEERRKEEDAIRAREERMEWKKR